jgi:Mn2+/Fe2+ NRAMP family transporter
VVIAVDVPWGEALKSILVPSLSFDSAHAMAVVAVLGTTISPYLFFWQAGQEVEEQVRRATLPLYVTPGAAGAELERIGIDTWVGMAISNLISLFIILATAATLHAHGQTDIQTSAQAAEALRPIAGRFAFVLFAAGIVGTGLLAIPVLAGSAAYGVCETFDWVEGLDHKLRDARAFYGVIALATLIGLMLNFVGVDPIKALYWSAVLNGVLAAPMMAAMLLIATNRKIMADFVLPWQMTVGGWIAALVMAVASVAFIALSVFQS